MRQRGGYLKASKLENIRPITSLAEYISQTTENGEMFDSRALCVFLSADPLIERGSSAESLSNRLPFAPGVVTTLTQAVDSKCDLSVLQQFSDNLEASVLLLGLLLGPTVDQISA